MLVVVLMLEVEVLAVLWYMLSPGTGQHQHHLLHQVVLITDQEVLQSVFQTKKPLNISPLKKIINIQ